MIRALALLLLFLLPLPPASGQTRRAPALKLHDLQRRTHRLDDYKGKVILLNFWATWCPPCRAEVPELVRWQREYGDRGLQVIGVTYPPMNRRNLRLFIRRYKINYPVLLGTKHTKTLFDESDTLPVTFIIDRDGTLLDRIDGILLPEEFNEKIKPLLR